MGTVTARSGAELEAQARERHAAADYRVALAGYEAAFNQYQAEGDVIAAARAARTVAWFRGWVLGEWAVAHGLAAQAQAMLEQVDDELALAWLRFAEARAGT